MKLEKVLFLRHNIQTKKAMNIDKRSKSEIIGDTLLDLCKISFAGIVFIRIFYSNINKLILTIDGVVFCFVCFTVGIYLITKK